LHVYLTITKKSYVGNDKYLEANAQAMDALKYTLSKDYFSMISHCDLAFAVWNTLSSLKEQALKNVVREPIVGGSNEACYMVQGNDSLVVTLGTHLDDYASSFNDHDSMDTHFLSEEFSMFC